MPSFVRFVGSTVAFNNKISFVAVKVSNVIAELMLPPEFEAKQSTIAQQSPKEFFRGRLVFPKFTSESFCPES